MSLSLIYWILMLLWAVLGVWGTWPSDPANRNWRPMGGNLLLFVLLLILGWNAFGAPVHN